MTMSKLIELDKVMDLINEVPWRFRNSENQKMLIKQVSDLPEASQWIDVKDRLPEVGEVILACGVGIRANYCKFERGLFYRFVDSTDMDRLASIWYDSITHWQPLPSKPIK